MCQRATCKTCGKLTYTGCGNHVDAVLAGVPASRRCDCETSPPATRRRSWFRAR